MRFLLNYSLKRLKRERIRSLAVPLITFTLVVLINALGGIREWLENQYEDIMENYSVIVELSSIDGTSINDLNIEMNTISFFTDPERAMTLHNHVSELALRRGIDAKVAGSDIHTDWVGITNFSADDKLASLTYESEAVVTFFDEYDKAILSSDEFVAIVSEDLFAFADNGALTIEVNIQLPDEFVYRDGLVVSGTSVHDLNYYIVEETQDGRNYIQIDPQDAYVFVEGELISASVELTVIGTVSDTAHSVVYSPFWAVAPFLEELTGIPLYSERLSMIVANNYELSTFKGTASLSFANRNPLFSTRPFAMTVNSLEFYETLEPLRQNAILVDVAIPIVYIISIGVGFFTSILLTRQRKSEFAVMRSVGVRSRDIFAGASCEQLLLSAIGTTLGLALIALVLGYLSFIYPAIFLACYMLGAVFSATRAANTNVLLILKEKE